MTRLDLLSDAYQKKHPPCADAKASALCAQTTEQRRRLEALLGSNGFVLMDDYDELFFLQMGRYYDLGFTAGFRTAVRILYDGLA